MNRQRLTWERLAARLPAATADAATQPPFGFSTRIVSQWRAARRHAALHRWTVWSFRTAMASTACALLVAFQSSRESTILVPLPEPPSPAHLPPP